MSASNPGRDERGHGDDPNWVTDEELKSLRMDRHYLVGLDGDGPTQALRILQEASPRAAMTIVRLAQEAESETVRLRAASYILDKTVAASDGDQDPWDEIRGKVVRSVEDYLASVSAAEGNNSGPDSDDSEA